MDAPEYLKALQRQDQLHDWLAAFMPRNTGGNDLFEIPGWVREQLKRINFQSAPDFISTYVKLLQSHDLGRNLFEQEVARLPSSTRHRFVQGSLLAVGSLTSSEFNGAVFKVPGSRDKHVVTLPLGSPMLAEFFCNLFYIHLSPGCHAHILKAYFESTEQAEGFFTKLKRTRRLAGEISEAKQRKYNIEETANQIQIQLHRYSCLGVVDPNDFIRDYYPIPLIGDDRRIGHPLELGTAYAYFVNRFLIRHECAHIMLSDLSIPQLEEEFQADSMAFSWGISQAKGKREQIGACIGAFIFLWLAGWIERISDEMNTSNTHPPVADRLKNLRLQLELKGERREMSSLVLGIVRKLVVEMEGLLDRLWDECALLRSANQNGSNSLQSTMSRSVNENNEKIFLDQIPRWLMFGAPSKLCFQLAKYRCDLEREMDEHNEDARKRHALLMKVYDMVEQRGNAPLSEYMIGEYLSIKKAMSKSNGHH
nr:hypothetical protein [uncultured Albidiferax sp.]